MGDGGDPSEWIPLFPKMADAGEGVLDLDEMGIIYLSTPTASNITRFSKANLFKP